METVKYRNKTYVVSRYVDKEDEKLLTTQKQKIAKLYFCKGLDSKDIARILKVDESVLNVWHDTEVRLESISKANKAFANNKAKKVICTNINTGVSVTYPSLSAAARAIGTVASTVRKALLEKKRYKNYSFKYIED